MKIVLISLGLCIILAGCMVTYFKGPRPQDPTDRPYRIEQITFAGGKGVTLAGELTMPQFSGPFTAIILVSGSGPNDRDETISGHRPALVLSDHLTKAGFAVLRYDDRGAGQSTGDYYTAALSDFAEDAAGAFTWLSKHPEIDSNAIGFIGASEGGYTAPVAAQNVPAAFLVFLAGPAIPVLPDLMSTQFADTQRAEGVGDDVIQQARQQYEAATAILSSSDTLENKRSKLDAYLISEGQSARQRRQTLDFWANPWGVEYASHDPAVALRTFSGPVLALFGSTDLQVSATENAPVMERLLGHPKSEVVVFDGLNHMFQRSDTGRISEYGKIETTIEPEVIEKIIDWIRTVSASTEDG
ncbi:alpha/beta hydrolase [Thalassobius sp. I31.1]|uniref:alpha/beta hydrolase family protein n=1 Tax=Thalassobius sp. I31.1 TaxID=2109912 RepID=UPI00130062D7|nr:alpha/beta hydrolase [Thalassobius sp. I31.1]